MAIPIYTVHYRCDRCEATFDTRGQLDDHVAAKHEAKCATCDRVFSNLAALKSHARTHEERDLECERCGKRFQSKKLLATHLVRLPESIASCITGLQMFYSFYFISICFTQEYNMRMQLKLMGVSMVDKKITV